MSETWGIVLAGGSGVRFGGLKQFQILGDRRLVDHAVASVSRACNAVVVVVPAGHRWDGAPVAAAVEGGPTRAASVRAGLAAVPQTAAVIVISDAAHPLAGSALFDRAIEAVRLGAAAAVPGITPVDVIKQVEGSRVVGTLPPKGCVVTQMPQAFRADALRRAHATAREAVEDSAMIEDLGLEVVLVEGDAANVHVTDPLSLAFASVVEQASDPGSG